MNTAIQTPSCPGVACATRTPKRFRRLLDAVHSTFNFRHFFVRPDSASPDDPWTTAVSQVEHLDTHVLADIGAPKWVIDEVSRRQRNDIIWDTGRKW